MKYDYRIKEILYKYYYKINDIIEIDSIIIYIKKMIYMILIKMISWIYVMNCVIIIMIWKY